MACHPVAPASGKRGVGAIGVQRYGACLIARVPIRQNGCEFLFVAKQEFDFLFHNSPSFRVNLRGRRMVDLFRHKRLFLLQRSLHCGLTACGRDDTICASAPATHDVWVSGMPSQLSFRAKVRSTVVEKSFGAVKISPLRPDGLRSR